MKLIIFQKFNYNYIFFIFFLICCIVEAIIEVNNAKEQKEINKKGKGQIFSGYNFNIGLFIRFFSSNSLFY